MIGDFFNQILIRPLLNLLVFLYNVVPGNDMGLAIIALTVAIRLLFWPLTQKAVRSQILLSKFQPEIKKIQEANKNNKEAQAKALMEFYSKNKINPLSGCLPLLIQLPILIALWRAFLRGISLSTISGELYSFVAKPQILHTVFLGIFDLTKRSVVLAILAGVLQFFQTEMSLPPKSQAKTGDMVQMMSYQMLYMGPILTIVIAWSLPAALPLFWVVTTLLTALQQYFIKKKVV